MPKVSDLTPQSVITGAYQTYVFFDGASYRTDFNNLIADLGLVQLVDGLIPVELLPAGTGGGGSGGSGNVTGPEGATDGLPVLFNGTSGQLLKAGFAWQLIPSGGTDGKFLGFQGGVPAWLDNSLAIGDGSLTFAKLQVVSPGILMGRLPDEGSGEIVPLTDAQARAVLGIEQGASADQTSAEIVAQLLIDVLADDAVAVSLSETLLAAVLRHLAIDPATVRENFSTAGILYSEGTISTNQVVVGAIDGTTAVQAADTTNGTPSVAGIVAGSQGMVATSDIIASVWSPRQATLSTGSLTFDASTGLQWTVAEGASDITIEESCWANIPLDKPAILELVAGASARTKTFANTSANLKIDTSASPWNSTSSGTRVRFELSWAAEGAAPTVKSKRIAVFLGYAP